ncbi:unnamed protein product [Dovyalis caffra]|uniref:Uncharacterized protein n=1 Tax=Dovyalis caffra TaxID=77055 RepID=A0AAV1RT09_9ROSI|nr:unnamed protein product [Dovyalis caffra]
MLCWFTAFKWIWVSFTFVLDNSHGYGCLEFLLLPIEHQCGFLLQILLDVVSVFNMVSSLSREKHSIKITQNGLEVFREYYPPNKEFVTLECVWETDKFVLVEKTHKRDVKGEDGGLGDGSVGKSAPRYWSLESFLGGTFSQIMQYIAAMLIIIHDAVLLSAMLVKAVQSAKMIVQVVDNCPLGNVIVSTCYKCHVWFPNSDGLLKDVVNSFAHSDSDLEKADEDQTAREGSAHIKEDTKHLFPGPPLRGEFGKQVEDGVELGDNPIISESPGKQLPPKDSLAATSSSPPSSKSKQVAFVSVKRPAPSTAAFISVKKPTTSNANIEDPHFKEMEDNSNRDDSFFNLLTGDNLKDSLF